MFAAGSTDRSAAFLLSLITRMGETKYPKNLIDQSFFLFLPHLLKETAEDGRTFFL